MGDVVNDGKNSDVAPRQNGLLSNVLSVLPVDKLLMPISYALSAGLFLFILEKGFDIQFSSCDFKEGSWTCKLSKVVKEIDAARIGGQEVIEKLDFKIKVLEAQMQALTPADPDPGQDLLLNGGAGSPVAATLLPVIPSAASPPGGVPPIVPSGPVRPAIQPSAALNTVAETPIPENLVDFLKPIGAAKDKVLGRTGYIFIGNKKDENTPVYLGRSQTDLIKFSDLVVGAKYVVSKNLTLRGGQPVNSGRYYIDQDNLGVVRVGMTVELEASPVTIQRGNLNQVWTKVKVIQ